MNNIVSFIAGAVTVGLGAALYFKDKYKKLADAEIEAYKRDIKKSQKHKCQCEKGDDSCSCNNKGDKKVNNDNIENPEVLYRFVDEDEANMSGYSIEYITVCTDGTVLLNSNPIDRKDLINLIGLEANRKIEKPFEDFYVVYEDTETIYNVQNEEG